MSTLIEKVRDGEFILSEANGTRSREKTYLNSAAPAMVSGTAVGVITSEGDYTIYNNSATNGSEVCAGILYTSVGPGPADRTVVIIKRDAEVSAEKLIGVDANAKADLLAAGIVVRGSAS